MAVVWPSADPDLPLMTETCGICRLHQDPPSRERYEISRTGLWVLRHHPDPAPLPGWLLLDSRRHCGGPLAFEPREAESWGLAVRDASQLVQQITSCDRVYAIAFGEGAPHLHLHLIPRFADDPATSAWLVADHYRAVQVGEREAAPAAQVQELVELARRISGS
jgi:diadenosine tetraphosphate (Ap4A) HIT family hydrolase